MGRQSNRRWLWLAAAIAAVAALGYGWQTSRIREWASYAQMALFRRSLAGALNREGASWTVRSSTNLPGELWIVHLDRNGTDAAAFYLHFLPSVNGCPRSLRQERKRLRAARSD